MFPNKFNSHKHINPKSNNIYSQKKSMCIISISKRENNPVESQKIETDINTQIELSPKNETIDKNF